MIRVITAKSVSYTHLDVYKRQLLDVADFGCVLPHAVQNKLNVAAVQLHKL